VERILSVGLSVKFVSAMSSTSKPTNSNVPLVTPASKLRKSRAWLLPLMANCNTCHNDVKVTNACESRHTRPETLLPLSHKQIAWAKEHKRLVRIEGLSNDCAVCHSDNFCQVCHAEATMQLPRGELQRGVAENRPSPGGRQALAKPRVHDLNFVFMHSLDLRSKQSDCYSCHNQ